MSIKLCLGVENDEYNILGNFCDRIMSGFEVIRWGSTTPPPPPHPIPLVHSPLEMNPASVRYSHQSWSHGVVG